MYQPPPAKSLPHEKAWIWFRRQSRRIQILLACVFVLSCSLCACVMVVAAATPSPRVIITPTATQQVILATDVVTPTDTPTALKPTPTAKPTQGPPRATIDEIEKDISFPYDPIIESYDQSTATVRVAFKFGTAVVVGPTTVKSVIKQYMKGHFDKHKDVYISKVAVQIYGTIRRGTAQNGYGVIARATMTRTNAQTIDWTFASDDEIWSKCSEMWMDQGVIENS